MFSFLFKTLIIIVFNKIKFQRKKKRFHIFLIFFNKILCYKMPPRKQITFSVSRSYSGVKSKGRLSEIIDFNGSKRGNNKTKDDVTLEDFSETFKTENVEIIKKPETEKQKQATVAGLSKSNSNMSTVSSRSKVSLKSVNSDVSKKPGKIIPKKIVPTKKELGKKADSTTKINQTVNLIEKFLNIQANTNNSDDIVSRESKQKSAPPKLTIHKEAKNDEKEYEQIVEENDEDEKSDGESDEDSEDSTDGNSLISEEERMQKLFTRNKIQINKSTNDGIKNDTITTKPVKNMILQSPLDDYVEFKTQEIDVVSFNKNIVNF
jgi:hypothetical protein